MSDWLVAYTEPHCEAKAARFGPLFGLSCYCPQTNADGRRGRVNRPLFPGYLFVANSWAGTAAAARSAIGIAGLVRLGDRPALLRQEAIDALHAREVGGIVPLPEKEPPERNSIALRPGMRIRVNLAAGLVNAVFRARQGSRRSVVYLGRPSGGQVRAVVENRLIMPA